MNDTLKNDLLFFREKLSNGIFGDRVGCFDLAIQAVEKQLPMKIKEIHLDEYFCPACGSENGCNDGVVGDNYCPNCGQRFDN